MDTIIFVHSLVTILMPFSVWISNRSSNKISVRILQGIYLKTCLIPEYVNTAKFIFAQISLYICSVYAYMIYDYYHSNHININRVDVENIYCRKDIWCTNVAH